MNQREEALKEFNGILGSLYSADGLDYELADWCRTNKDIIRKALAVEEAEVIDVNDENTLKELSDRGVNDSFDIAVALIKIREKYPNGIIIKGDE